jgi:uncharacterized membrane protein
MVDLLHGVGLIPTARYFEAVQAVRDTPAWNKWARGTLLALGAGQLIAGAAFFFAYNWDGLEPLAKFAIVQAALVLCLIGALAAGLDRRPGQALLIGASALTGILLAVTGQVYQTGADAYELFATWALLMSPWVLISASSVHWLLWLVVCLTALILHWAQVLEPIGAVSDIELGVILGGLLALVLGTRELAADAGIAWVAVAWTRLIPLFTGLLCLFLAALAWILGETAEPLGLIAFVPAALAALLAYGRGRVDPAAVAITGAFVALAAMAGGARLIAENVGFDWSSRERLLTSLGLLLLWCILITAGSVALLSRLLGRQRHRI